MGYEGNAEPEAALSVDHHDTIRPRLDAHHADPSRIHLLKGIVQPPSKILGKNNGKVVELMFSLGDIDILRKALEKLHDCRLIVIDPALDDISRESKRAIASHLSAIKAFTKWLAIRHKLPRDLLASVKKPNPKADRRIERRALLPKNGIN